MWVVLMRSSLDHLMVTIALELCWFKALKGKSNIVWVLRVGKRQMSCDSKWLALEYLLLTDEIMTVPKISIHCFPQMSNCFFFWKSTFGAFSQQIVMLTRFGHDYYTTIQLHPNTLVLCKRLGRTGSRRISLWLGLDHPTIIFQRSITSQYAMSH